MPDLYTHYIDGQWTESASGETFENRNPANGELVGEFAKGGTAEIGRAVEAAKRAFATWRLYPAPHRGEILYRVGQLLREQKESLARDMTREMGKVLAEARGDVQEGIDMAFYMAGEGRRQFGQVVPSELRDKWAMSHRRPIGVVGLITPWNFPMAIPTWKIMPALICGNTVVFKPASYTPLTAYRLVKIFEEAGLPRGVLNIVFGTGGEVGNALIEHPDVKLISFTGSTEVGDSVAAAGARGRKRVMLELGGKNAVMVMEDADLDLATEGIIWSAFGTSGQRCTAASRVIVHQAVYRDLLDKLVAKARQLTLGDGLDEGTDVGPVISDSQLERIHSYIPVGEREGAEVAIGGKVVAGGAFGKGFYHEPTIFAGVTPDMRVAREEIFGPVTSVIPVQSLDQAIEVVNQSEYGLSASIYTQDVNRAFRAMRDVDTGILYVNAGTIGAEIQLPFGGTKATGNGHREAGTAALDVFSEWQALYIDYSGKLQKAQIDAVGEEA
ncbi:MAG TPA: aldehyde dehydrogenase family protein [Thermomicrobiales bacterium]